MTFLKAAYPGEYEMLRQSLSLLIFSDMIIFSGFNLGIVLAFAMGSNIMNTVILSTIKNFLTSANSSV